MCDRKNRKRYTRKSRPNKALQHEGENGYRYGTERAMIRAWRQSPTKHAPKSDRGEPDNDRGLKVIAPLSSESDTPDAPIGALGVFF